MYIFGGRDKENVSNRFYCLDLYTQTWTKLATDNAPTPRSSHIFVSTNHSLFVIGG